MNNLFDILLVPILCYISSQAKMSVGSNNMYERNKMHEHASATHRHLVY